jgi:uncharacterized protein YkwD
MRKLAAASAAVLCLLAAACTPEEADTVTAINDFRHANGVHGLAWEEGAYAKARSWSEHMAKEGRLSHSVLSEGVPSGWRVIGENVAMDTSLEGAWRGLEKSPGHRANLLNPRFNRVAVGVVHHNGYYWITQVFIG